jgi:hypothetical protein
MVVPSANDRAAAAPTRNQSLEDIGLLHLAAIRRAYRDWAPADRLREVKTDEKVELLKFRGL